MHIVETRALLSKIFSNVTGAGGQAADLKALTEQNVPILRTALLELKVYRKATLCKKELSTIFDSPARLNVVVVIKNDEVVKGIFRVLKFLERLNS